MQTMQTMETAAQLLEALRPLIEDRVVHDAGNYGVEAIVTAHRMRWAGVWFVNDPSTNHLRSEAARGFLLSLGWKTHGDPHDEHIRALLAAGYGIEYAMLASGASSWVPDDVATLLEPFRQS
jgi:hypothetical protein